MNTNDDKQEIDVQPSKRLQGYFMAAFFEDGKIVYTKMVKAHTRQQALAVAGKFDWKRASRLDVQTPAHPAPRAS